MHINPKLPVPKAADAIPMQQQRMERLPRQSVEKKLHNPTRGSV